MSRYPNSLSAVLGLTGFDQDGKLTTGQQSESAATEVKIETACRACISNCSVIATIRNGRVVALEGNPKDPMSKGHMCAKGMSGIQALYNPYRNKYPMLRVGERGKNKWKRISWDEALDLIADHIIETKRDYGAESILCSTGGGGNPEFWSISRFCNIVQTPNWFEPGCAQCYLPRMCTYKMMYGGNDPSIADSNAHEIYYKDSKIAALVLWGAGPSYSSPAMGGAAVNALRARGVKTVVIDPRMTPDAAKADVWLPIRPGSDVALGLAWIRYVIWNDLFDHEFVKHWTNLPYLVNTQTKYMWRAEEIPGPSPDVFMVFDRKTGKPQPLAYPYNEDYDIELDAECVIDGVVYKTGFRLLCERVAEWTIEKAADVCWLHADQIEKAIKIYVENSPHAGICIGVATDQSPNSAQAPQCTMILEGLMGNVEGEGNLLQRFPGSGVFSVGYIVPPAPSKLSKEQFDKRLGNREHKGLNFWMAAHAPTILDTMESGKPYPIRMWLERSGNKLVNVADGQRWAEASKNVPFIVHMYMYPTSFSQYADLLLPTEEWLETDMMQESCNHFVVRQACTHLFETIDETAIWSFIAKRAAEKGDEDCKKAFDPEYMGDDLVYWDSVEDLLDIVCSRAHTTWEKLKHNALCEYMPEEKFRNYYAYKQIDPKTGKANGFDTTTRKLGLYHEDFITLGRTGFPFAVYPMEPADEDYDPLPYYLEPFESPLGEMGKDYPLVMTNGRLPMFHHSTLRNNAYTRELFPAPEVWIHPSSAERFGIQDDSWVWVESERGRVRGVAHITTGINPGAVYMERYWNPETMTSDTHGWKEMNVSVLARSRAPYNDVFGTYTLRGYLVKVYPAPEGAPEGIYLDPKDFKPFLATPSDPTADMTKEGKKKS